MNEKLAILVGDPIYTHFTYCSTDKDYVDEYERDKGKQEVVHIRERRLGPSGRFRKLPE